ncbi:MAG: polysaccharide deacetylase family protein [Alphaproteobacteria bacterium]|nr:polysaccharide deacetylase family protein [Alphaproteobacteria bacterium]
MTTRVAVAFRPAWFNSILSILCLFILCLLGPGPRASAAECPGNPGALGTSRVLVVDPRAHPRIGSMQYPEALPLEDHEVVLTFDDGPLPKYSNQILRILDQECIKATFFIIGKQANASPETVRRVAAAGHSVGTHTQDHPLALQNLPLEQAIATIDNGIASTSAALGDPSLLAPFFRVPGLHHSREIDAYLASRNLQLWSSDFVADDWRDIGPDRVAKLAIERIEARGKGILLLHDIQPRTVAALPMILRELKSRGYRIVHVVPATAERPATPTRLVQWRLSRPAVPMEVTYVPDAGETLPIPTFTDQRGQLDDSLTTGHETVVAAAQTLPIPGRDLFSAPEEPLVLVPNARLDSSRRAFLTALIN